MDAEWDMNKSLTVMVDIGTLHKNSNTISYICIYVFRICIKSTGKALGMYI